MSVLSSGLRKVLEDACVRGRRAADDGARAALGSLAVAEAKVPAHLGEGERALRRGLRAKSRQLGDDAGSIELLVAECGFEQWHRLLFARFLSENGLLIHPVYRAPVTLAECDELAESLGEPDGWSVAGRFASEILPGIFRLEDPCVQLRLAPEGRAALERIVAGLPGEVFTADDSLGWVYQFWQKEQKDRVNASERKIGGADLGPVTQLFTENYMVRFLLENSLGAWWAARHPDSPLVKEWEYLRFDDEGAPAAGSFEGWPERVAEVTVADPCAGSGHFLVEAFDMLWKMRVEEDGLSPVAAQDAVLRDNLFGLELDPRCVQIAMFAVAITAWKAGGGWRELPVPHVACSGIPVKAPVEEWKALAGGDERLENALVRLHILFRDADTLGSLIDPKRAVEISDPTGLQQSFEDVDWDDIAPLLERLLERESDDPSTAVLGADAAGTARAADYLSRKYTLIATNPPFLGRGTQSEPLRRHLAERFVEGYDDLATSFVLRAVGLLDSGGSLSMVTPQSWLFLRRSSDFREKLLKALRWRFVAQLGEGAFESSQAAGAMVSLICAENLSIESNAYVCLELLSARNPVGKAQALLSNPFSLRQQKDSLQSKHKSVMADRGAGQPLGDFANSWEGLVTADVNQYLVKFWELSRSQPLWERYLTAPPSTADYTGRDSYLRWDRGSGRLVSSPTAHNFNPPTALGKPGVLVAPMRNLRATIYAGEMFNQATVPIVPHDANNVAALWAYCNSPDFTTEVRRVNQKLKVDSGYFLQVPFDVEHWRKVAEERWPDGLPEPWSDDPTQWLFEGRPEVATEPLQVAVGRLLGFRWPEQSESDDLDELADDDGIVCLSSLRGERPAAERLQELLARAYGSTWSPARTTELLSSSGSRKKDLESWLRDDFFKAHCAFFKHRPFIWQIWDGHKEGFSALVNYHRLDRANLERLTYTYLGDWIERQTAGVREDVTGAEARLDAAQDLQRRLALILEGEPPFDIYVRWKALAEQATGWDPDLNDGVRLNVRPFVEAGVLRSKFNVKWGTDRGKNPDGSVRDNDVHLTLAEKTDERKGLNS